jgi:hypothetical protein
MHCPAWQLRVAEQALPQAPQFALFVLVSTQPVPQIVSPVPQAVFPMNSMSSIARL